MGRVEADDEATYRYYVSLYGKENIWRDPETGELMFNRSARNDLQGQLKSRSRVEKPVAKNPKLNMNRPGWPGKGAGDEKWREYAMEAHEIAGSITRVPQIPSGRGRGLKILDLIRGFGVEHEWGCGCKEDGKGNFYPCGTNYCEVDPSS